MALSNGPAGPPASPEPPSVVRVLVVDDDPDHRALARAALRRSKRGVFEVTLAEDEAQALAHVAMHTIDALVVDYHLQSVDGLAVVARLREAGVHVPVLLLTGEGSEQIATRALRAGVDDYLNKQSGLTGDTLARAVQEMTVRHQLAKSLEASQQEAIRLEGVLLAARTAAHLINNQLAVVVGYSELLAKHPAMPPALRPMASQSFASAQEAARTLQ